MSYPSEGAAAVAPRMRREASVEAGPSQSQASVASGGEPDRRNLAKADQIISNFFSKTLQVLTAARLTHVDDAPPPSPSTSSGFSAAKPPKISKWFNLQTPEPPSHFRAELRTWKGLSASADPVPPMLLDFVLDAEDVPPGQALLFVDAQGGRTRIGGEGRERKRGIVLERWKLELIPPADDAPAPPELPVIYKRSIVLFRSLYALVRLLPAYSLHRRLKKRNARGSAGLKIGCRLSMRPVEMEGELPLEAPLSSEPESDRLENFEFGGIATPLGTLQLTTTYRAHVDLVVDDVETLLSSRFVDEDYYTPTLLQHRRRRESGSTPGSLPTPPSAPVPDRGQPSSYGSLSIRHQQQQPIPNTTSPHTRVASVPIAQPASLPTRYGGEGDFAGSFGRSGASRVRTSSLLAGRESPSSASPLPVRPLNPFRAGPASFSPSSPLRQSSFGPSSSSPLHTSSSRPPLVPPTFSSGSPTPSLTAQRSPHSPLAAQPIPPPMPKRYSSSFGYRRGSAASSGGSAGEGGALGLRNSPGAGVEGQGTLGRRRSSRLAGSPSGTPETGQSAQGGQSSFLSQATDEDDIGDFIRMIDSKPNLRTASSPAARSVMSRSQLEDTLRRMAGSVDRSAFSTSAPTSSRAASTPSSAAAAAATAPRDEEVVGRLDLGGAEEEDAGSVRRLGGARGWGEYEVRGGDADEGRGRERGWYGSVGASRGRGTPAARAASGAGSARGSVSPRPGEGGA